MLPRTILAQRILVALANKGKRGAPWRGTWSYTHRFIYYRGKYFDLLGKLHFSLYSTFENYIMKYEIINNNTYISKYLHIPRQLQTFGGNSVETRVIFQVNIQH